jgi:hypothetical protein
VFRKRNLGRLLIVLVLCAGVGVYALVRPGRPGGPPGQRFGGLADVLRPRFGDWGVARPPDFPGPYRIPDGLPVSTAGPGQPLVGALTSARGRVPFDVPAADHREQAVVPLETDDGRLTFVVLQREVSAAPPRQATDVKR